jgi:hypothetical protein
MNREARIVKLCTDGVTRLVILVGPWALKLPRGMFRDRRWFGWWIRGWLANRSEWRQRHRSDVCPLMATVGHFVLIARRGEPVDREAWEDSVVDVLVDYGYSWEEAKASSWARFDGRALLVDFDRAWQQGDRGWIGGWYYGRQERAARRWLAMPLDSAEPGCDGEVPASM